MIFTEALHPIKRLVAIQTCVFNLNLTELNNVCTCAEQSWKSGIFAFHFYPGSHWLSFTRQKERDNGNIYKHWHISHVTHAAWKVLVFGVFLVRIFPHSDWIRRDTEYLSVFKPNMGKYGPGKLWMRTLFTNVTFRKTFHHRSLTGS